MVILVPVDKLEIYIFMEIYIAKDKTVQLFSATRIAIEYFK